MDLRPKISIPKLYTQQEKEVKDIVLYVRYYIFNSSWYIAEFDDENTFYAAVKLPNTKDLPNGVSWQFVRLSDLEAVKTNGGGIEMDLSFKPVKLNDLFIR